MTKEGVIFQSYQNYKIISKATRTRYEWKTYDEGYLVQHEDEIYFIYDGDRPLDRYWSTIENHWCWCDVDENDGYIYRDDDDHFINIADCLRRILRTKRAEESIDGFPSYDEAGELNNERCFDESTHD